MLELGVPAAQLHRLYLLQLLHDLSEVADPAVLTITRNGRTEREVHMQRGYPVPLVIQLLPQAVLTPLGAHDFQTLGQPQRSSSRVVHVARKEMVEQ